jgi:hypothetical protein
MPVNLLCEDVIALRDVPHLIPEVATRYLTSPSIQTLIKWCNVGIAGVRLENAKVGYSRITSRQAVRRFISQTGRMQSALKGPVP